MRVWMGCSILVTRQEEEKEEKGQLKNLKKTKLDIKRKRMTVCFVDVDSRQLQAAVVGTASESGTVRSGVTPDSPRRIY